MLDENDVYRVKTMDRTNITICVKTEKFPKSQRNSEENKDRIYHISWPWTIQ